MRYLDLFSGIGGFALGAYWAGCRFNGHYFSEVDEYAIKIYKQRFPDAVGLGDIRNIRGEDLPAGEWIIAGGFPCQDISIAGKGAGLEGSRSGLWYEYARILAELRPSFAIIENVGALVGRGLDQVLGSLAEIGYDAEWQDIRASDVGAPHRRERIWIVAYPSSDAGDEWRTESAGQFGTTRSTDGGNDVAHPCGSGLVPGSHGGICGEKEGTRPRYEQPERCGKTMADASNSGDVRWDWELGATEGEVRGPGRSPSHGCREWWAAEPDVGRVAHGVPARVDRLKCLGNSIVPQIAELIFRHIVELAEEPKP